MKKIAAFLSIFHFLPLSYVASEGDGKQLHLPTQAYGRIFLVTSVHPYNTAAHQWWRQFASITTHGK